MAKASGDPSWLKSMKREAERLGIPLRELLTRSMKPGAAPKAKPKAKAKAKTMVAAKGGMGMKKKGYAKGGMGMKKKGAAKGGMMKKKGYAKGGAVKKAKK
jgi:hypothetical protein